MRCLQSFSSYFTHVDSIFFNIIPLQNGFDNSYSEGLEEHNGQSTVNADTGVDDESDSELGITAESQSQY